MWLANIINRLRAARIQLSTGPSLAEEPACPATFAQYFLTDGLQHTPEWQASASWPQTFTVFADAVRERLESGHRALPTRHRWYQTR